MGCFAPHYLAQPVPLYADTPDGGTLLIGVDDDGNILSLKNDYQAFTKKPNRDGYDLWLINDLLLKEMHQEWTARTVSFHSHGQLHHQVGYAQSDRQLRQNSLVITRS